MRKPFQKKISDEKDVDSWERLFGQILTPFEKFMNTNTSSGIILLLCTVLALIWANSPWSASYDALLQLPIAFSFGSWSLEMSAHHWINDGLMAFFFYLVGLEIKREILVGELSRFSQAILPAIAAVGGMIVPALIFYLFNAGDEGAQGWGIPMATDIAFALAVLSLLGKRVSTGAFALLAAIAIVDDLGAVLIIALFYTEHLNLVALALSFFWAGMMFVLNRGGIRHPLPYMLLAGLTWLAMLHSGVHATIAGVIGALMTPARSWFSTQEFSRDAHKLLEQLKESDANNSFLADQHASGILLSLHTGINRSMTVLQRMEHHLYNLVYYFIVPLFVLANAGVRVDAGQFFTLLSQPVTLGVMCGLLIGKPLGIFGSIWLATRFKIGVLPAHVNNTQIFGIALLAGIGFTMSIFISELAFAGQEQLLIEAKMGILLVSLCAGVIAYTFLRVYGGSKVHLSEEAAKNEA